LDKKGNIISDLGKVISELRCNTDEQQLNVSKEDKQSLFTGLRKLEESFKKDYQCKVESESKKDPVIVKAIKKLVYLRKEIENDQDLVLIDKISNVLTRGIPDETLKDLRRLERVKIDGNGYLKRLIGIYNRYRLGDLRYTEKDEQEYKPVELICCEMLK